MRAPAFWAGRTPSWTANLLRPAASLYGAVAARRLRRPSARAALPVVCVGNFTIGGAGKTPTALAIAGLLRRMGHRPALLSRGYGGRLAGPVRVDPAAHGPDQVGDEPLLLARAHPTVVSRDRPAGARLCAELGATVVVMDDGLQNPSLVKDLAVAVVDGERGLGNGLCLPAGPLRAPLAAQWPLVQAVILVGPGEAGTAVAGEAQAGGVGVIRAALEPDPAVAAALAGRRVLAVAGIAHPAKFFATLARCGALIEGERAFPDHHPYAASDLEALAARAARDGLMLVTTEKDAVKLQRLAQPSGLAVTALPVTLVFEDEALVTAMLERLA